MYLAVNRQGGESAILFQGGIILYIKTDQLVWSEAPAVQGYGSGSQVTSAIIYVQAWGPNLYCKGLTKNVTAHY